MSRKEGPEERPKGAKTKKIKTGAKLLKEHRRNVVDERKFRTSRPSPGVRPGYEKPEDLQGKRGQEKQEKGVVKNIR